MMLPSFVGSVRGWTAVKRVMGRGKKLGRLDDHLDNMLVTVIPSAQDHVERQDKDVHGRAVQLSFSAASETLVLTPPPTRAELTAQSLFAVLDEYCLDACHLQGQIKEAREDCPHHHNVQSRVSSTQTIGMVSSIIPFLNTIGD